MSEDFTPALQHWMQQAGFFSFRALSQAAGISEKQLRRLRRGEIAQVRIETLLKLSQALQIPTAELFSALTNASLTPDPTDFKHEYARLQTQLSQQRQDLWQEFQQSSVQVLESLLLQLPTAAYAAQQNPQAPAVKLLPLLRPIDRLLQEWGIEAITSVGAEVAYDPQQHQLMEGTAAVGEPVRVRYTGYRQGDKLLYRAKVSPVGRS